MEPKFKEGDWCFCEFKLQQVQRTQDNRINAVSDGRFEMSSYDLTDKCYPLSLVIKNISDSVAYHSNKFHSIKSNSLNHPDLNRKLIELWIDMCEAADHEKQLKIKYEALDRFGEAVINAVKDIRATVIDGVNIFTR